MKPLVLLSLVAAAVMLQPRAEAHEEIYSAVLSGANVSPPNGSPGTGFVTFTWDLDLFTLRIQADFTNLQGTVTAAHIHAATLMPFTGTAGIATQLPSLPAFPTGGTSGTYDQTIDFTLASSYNPDFIAANGGTVATAANVFYNAFRDGRAYFDIETSSFSGGEISGFVGVPEPSTTALLSAGVFAAAVGSWRRRCKK